MKKLNIYSIYLSTKKTEHKLYSFGVMQYGMRAFASV